MSTEARTMLADPGYETSTIIADEGVYGTLGYIAASPNGLIGNLKVVLVDAYDRALATTALSRWDAASDVLAGSAPFGVVLHMVNEPVFEPDVIVQVTTSHARPFWPKPVPTQPDEAFADYEWVMRRKLVELAHAWEHDCEVLSTFRAATRHQAYSTFMSLGTAGVEVALSRLTGQHRPLWLGFLTRAIPCAERPDVAHPGSIAESTEIWLAWGHAHGYIT